MTEDALVARIAEVRATIARYERSKNLKAKYALESMREMMADLERKLEIIRWLATVAESRPGP